MKKIIKRVYKIFIKGSEKSIGISVMVLITLLMILTMVLTSCTGDHVLHNHCLPGCEETYIDSLDNHDYDPEGVWGQEIHNK